MTSRRSEDIQVETLYAGKVKYIIKPIQECMHSASLLMLATSWGQTMQSDNHFFSKVDSVSLPAVNEWAHHPNLQINNQVLKQGLQHLGVSGLC